jgi:hypothetical protein
VNKVNPSKIVKPKKKNWVKLIPLIVLADCIGLLVLGAIACQPQTFDPVSTKQQIGSENYVQMTWAEYEATTPRLWNDDSKTLTIPLPVVFKDNQIRSLRIEKVKSTYFPTLADEMIIDGLQQGDVIFSPFDGEVELDKYEEKYLGSIFLYAKGPKDEQLSIVFATTTLNNLLNFSHPIADTIRVPVKKGDSIGSLDTSNKHRVFNGQIEMDGGGPLCKYFNLATTPEGKVILITK